MQKDAEHDGGVEREVSITGEPQCVEYAKQLIQQKVQEVRRGAPHPAPHTSCRSACSIPS